MGTILATKQDLEILTLATKQDMALLRGDMENRFALQAQKLDTLELRLTVKLGSMMVVGFWLTIAALRLWSG